MSEWMIEPCPFCGNTKVELIASYYDVDEHRTFWKRYDHAKYLEGNRTGYFRCICRCRKSNCSTDGPERDTPEDAVASWNAWKERSSHV